jgi:hypothetical protein
LLFDTAKLNAVVALVDVHSPECGAIAVVAGDILCYVAANVAVVFLLLSTPDSEAVEAAVIGIIRITRPTVINCSIAMLRACTIDAHDIVTTTMPATVYYSTAVALVATVNF